MAELAARNFVERRRINIHPELPLSHPVMIWNPGDQEPDFGAVSYQLKARWGQPLLLTTFYTATKQTARHFGAPPSAGGPLKRPHQATHELHVSALYLKTLRVDPAAANAWTLDHQLTRERRKQKRPDAVLKNTDGSDRIALEFGGAYDARRVRLFHEDCLARSLPYELW